LLAKLEENPNCPKERPVRIECKIGIPATHSETKSRKNDKILPGRSGVG
jgi:hypothetical protein